MDLARHCDLCDNQKTSLKEGITCGLTDQKPEFNITCTKIELNEKFELKLKDVNIRFQKVDGAKVLTYIYFIVFLTIGFAVMIGGYLLGKYALDSGVISTVPIIIIAIGLAPIAMAFGALNKYRLDLEISKNKKNRIDQVLKLYRIEYVIDIKFGKEYHGTQDVYADLKFKGNRCGAFK
jgi:hypothetical protein